MCSASCQVRGGACEPAKDANTYYGSLEKRTKCLADQFAAIDDGEGWNEGDADTFLKGATEFGNDLKDLKSKINTMKTFSQACRASGSS